METPGLKFKIARVVGQGKGWSGVNFLPVRKSCIPCHSKFDTETVGLMFIKAKDRKKKRSEAENRSDYNDYVWSNVLKIEKIRKKN